MKLLAWFLRLFQPCIHVYAYQKTIDEQNLRSGHKHRSAIFKCDYCGATKTVEQPD